MEGWDTVTEVGWCWGHGVGLEVWDVVGDVGWDWMIQDGVGGSGQGQYGSGWCCGAGEVMWDMGAVFDPLDLADILRGALPHLAHGCFLHLHWLHLQ